MNINEFIKTLHNKENIKAIIKEKYIPIEDKRNIALEVFENCVSEDDGYVQIDHFKRDIYFDIAMLREYTNLKLSYDFESMIEEYDVLCENDIPLLVFNYIGNDYIRSKQILEYEEQSILNKNSLEVQVAKISSAMVNTLNIVNNKFNDFNINDILPEDTDINKLLETLNKLT